jgi:hypothetical protein
MCGDIPMGSLIYIRTAIEDEKNRLRNWPELLIESRQGLPMLDFRLLEPKLILRGELITRNNAEIYAFTLQLVACVELVQDRFQGKNLTCILDLPHVTSYFESVIGNFIQTLALWSFENDLEIEFLYRDEPEPEIGEEIIQYHIAEAWAVYKNTPSHNPQRRENVKIGQIE